MPCSISGTNCFGSLMNFFMRSPLRRDEGCG
jgi:hypothetical protein